MSTKNFQPYLATLIAALLSLKQPIRIASNAFLFATFLGASAGAFVPVYAGGEDGKGDADRGLACGPNLVCDPSTQYCSILYGGPVGVPPSYACADLPANSPSTPTCESIQATGCKCTESVGRITVTCTAP